MSKRKGSNAERELVRTFWSRGWAAVRVAGSGSSHYPSPDLVVGNLGRRLAIEAKITKETKKYFPREEIRQLLYYCKIFGAESWIAIKFPKMVWKFISPEDMEETPQSYVVSAELLERRGVTFEELIDEGSNT